MIKYLCLRVNTQLEIWKQHTAFKIWIINSSSHKDRYGLSLLFTVDMEGHKLSLLLVSFLQKTNNNIRVNTAENLLG